MKLRNHGKSISEAEIVNISQHGIWLSVNDTEYFLPYTDFPWFKKATIASIHNFRLLNANHIYWPTLDVDLELDSLANPEKYPLIYK